MKQGCQRIGARNPSSEVELLIAGASTRSLNAPRRRNNLHTRRKCPSVTILASAAEATTTAAYPTKVALSFAGRFLLHASALLFAAKGSPLALRATWLYSFVHVTTPPAFPIGVLVGWLPETYWVDCAITLKLQ